MGNPGCGAAPSGIWCAGLFSAADQQRFREVGPPTWTGDDADFPSLTLIVNVQWWGQPLFVSGHHLGPGPGDTDWDHLEIRSPAGHWLLDWMVPPASPDADPTPLTDHPQIHQQLPSEQAWNAIGAWLLGTALAKRLESLDCTPEALTADLAAWLDFFCRRTAER